MKKYLSLFSLVMGSLFLWGQQDSIIFEDARDAEDFEAFQKQQMVIQMDSLNASYDWDESFYEINEEGQILLDEASVMAMPKFKTALERNYYYWLKKKLYNAYPYYLKAIRNYENLSDSLVQFEKNKKVKKYVKKRQKELADQYENQLRDLTRTEGQILSKLLFRRTHKTTYEIIKELRGSFNAYVWEAKAGLFDISLKKEYHPNEVREDYYLENLLKIGLRNGDLELED